MSAVTSEAAVCNLALGLLGQRQFIDNLDEATTEAQACKVYFASARNALLQRWGWRFATKRKVLELTTEVRSGWEYAYRLPADMMLEAPARIWDGQREPGAGERIPFGVELDDAGGGHLVLTDQPDAELLYTRELTAVALWPALFVDAVAARLAVRLAPTLTAKPPSQLLISGAELAFQMAAAASGNAAQGDQPADSELISVRG